MNQSSINCHRKVPRQHSQKSQLVQAIASDHHLQSKQLLPLHFQRHYTEPAVKHQPLNMQAINSFHLLKIKKRLGVFRQLQLLNHLAAHYFNDVSKQLSPSNRKSFANTLIMLIRKSGLITICEVVVSSSTVL